MQKFRAKKSMGQNFLKSQKAISDIVSAGEITKNDTILEIGPGKGVLTEKLIEKSSKVIAIEKDRDLFELLQNKFQKEMVNGKLELVLGDILDFNTEKKNEKTLLGMSSNRPSGSTRPFQKVFSRSSYKIIANIPYNITGEILRKFLSADNKPSKMVLLVQKEVAERVVAKNKKESILSLSVKIYGNPRYISKVEARYFSPEPKVDSAIIEISNISNKKLEGIDENTYFKIIKAGFAHKRKLLKKNLETEISKKTISTIFEELNISDNARAEDIPFDLWVLLAKSI